MMQRNRRAVLGIALLALSLSALPAAAADTGYRADLIYDIEQLEQKIIALAEAIPADQFSWRPSEGVRSVSEAIMHAAQANFFFANALGVAPPEGIQMGQLESITDKAEVIEVTKKSFATLAQMVNSKSDEQLAETINLFGREWSVAGALHAAVSHDHEHLGQLIAYARSIGVTPPWSQ